MGKTEKKEKRFGLLGKNISYSFSKGYFTKKFESLGLDDHSYENFDIPNITEFKALISDNRLSGMNVTIPYKELVMPYLQDLDDTAKSIGAVNTIRFTEHGLIGFNTDYYGFQKSLEPALKPTHNKALILGTGGASKAVSYALEQLNIENVLVSRSSKPGQLTYKELSQELITEFTVIVNCTPLGTYPKVKDKPDLPYEYLTSKHLLFDLIYNPSKTTFLELGALNGATIINGQKMLEYQAEKAWEIWNTP
ncbi:shikimate dehydrogenase [Muricauda sp. 2012CJ35-5]|uniref:Shikimate dehydrogenase n=1 Tax=Flagellimonas spongiicola TaxID=2942208 RepID=A0ABT0PN44_9FLAO|nr:shikimate dehydrogenase [Allomuricauda spongiicola]MCL6272804.1 shikimate dehydrogenase [Allomuricauda spongiicola]